MDGTEVEEKLLITKISTDLKPQWFTKEAPVPVQFQKIRSLLFGALARLRRAYNSVQILENKHANFITKEEQNPRLPRYM